MTTFKTIEGSAMHSLDHTVPFRSGEEAWFWFIQAQTARNDGAQIKAGTGLFPRPCEPVDIFRVLDRLYRSRRISIHHARVLKTYGQRMLAPDANRPRERAAHSLWKQALERLEEMLVIKKIVVKPHWLSVVTSHDA